MPYAFDAVTAVTPVVPGMLTADLDPGWSIGTVLNGGYLLAVVARAAMHGDPPHPHPVATSASFLRAPVAGPAEVRVEQLRTGRTLTISRSVLGQGGAPVLDATVTTGHLPAGAGPEWTDLPPVGVAPPEECIEGTPDMLPGERVGLYEHLEVRIDPATGGFLGGRPSGQMEIRGWARLRDGREPDPPALLLIVDSLPPVSFGLGRFGWAPTVQLTVYVRAVPEPGWLRIALRGRLLAGGFFDEEATAWDSAGRLVAQSRQLALAPRTR